MLYNKDNQETILQECNMDFDSYYQAYFTKPQPQPRFQYTGNFGITLFYEDYDQAVAFYETVLGSAGYQEGDHTRGWKIGNGWLTLLKGKKGTPTNVELTFELETVAEAEAMQRTFIQAGASGTDPSDQLMYAPVRLCPVVDPLGVDVMIFARI
jgi:uncharacterized glyoxalase superfamily protein PhnB